MKCTLSIASDLGSVLMAFGWICERPYRACGEGCAWKKLGRRKGQSQRWGTLIPNKTLLFMLLAVSKVFFYVFISLNCHNNPGFTDIGQCPRDPKYSGPWWLQEVREVDLLCVCGHFHFSGIFLISCVRMVMFMTVWPDSHREVQETQVIRENSI